MRIDCLVFEIEKAHRKRLKTPPPRLPGHSRAPRDQHYGNTPWLFQLSTASHNAYVYCNQIIMISNSIMESCWDFMLQMIQILCVLMYYCNCRWHSESPKWPKNVNSPTSIMLQRETCWRPCRPASNRETPVCCKYSQIKGPEVGPE